MGKTRIIAETGAGQHGVATATVGALFGLPCTVFMGERDIERQQPNVFRMKLLGAEVRPVTLGLAHAEGRDERGAARLGRQRRRHLLLIGTVAGPHPYPAMVRDFQSVIGNEAKRADAGGGRPPAGHAGRLPSAAAPTPWACSTRSSTTARADGRRRGGRATASTPARHAASLTGGPPGRAARQPHLPAAGRRRPDDRGRIRSPPASTIPASARSIPGCKNIGRVEYVAATDEEALAAFQLCSQARGHHPGAGAGACAGPGHQARADAGRGPDHRDESVRPRRQGHLHRGRAIWESSCERPRSTRRFAAAARRRAAPAWSPFSRPATPTPTPRSRSCAGLPAAGADVIELGMPFTDPMADGPAIQAAALRALQAGRRCAATLAMVRGFRAGDGDDADRADGLLQPDLLPTASERFLRPMPRPPASTA